MQLLVANLIGKNCVDQNRQKVGRIKRPIVNSDIGKVLGFVLGNKKAIPLTSISEVAKEVRVTALDSLEVNLETSVTTMIGKKVKTDAGRKIGRLFDLGFELESGYIGKIYVHRLVFGIPFREYLYNRNQIVEVTKRWVIVRDKEKIRAVAAATETP